MRCKKRFKLGNYLVLHRKGFFRVYDPKGKYCRHFASAGAAAGFIFERKLSEKSRLPKTIPEYSFRELQWDEQYPEPIGKTFALNEDK